MPKYFKRKSNRKKPERYSYDYGSVYNKPSMGSPDPALYQPYSGDFSYHYTQDSIQKERRRIKRHRKLIPERRLKIWEGLYDKKNKDVRDQIKAETKEALKKKNK